MLMGAFLEVFKVFATLSLMDMISGPLGRINSSLHEVGNGAASLSARFGSLAASMAPLALGAGAVLGAFGKCVSTAAGFEDQMAKVGAVSRASASELEQLEARARELGASTQFTASQVGQAEQYLAMAGFSVEDNIAALPGVLNLAAATATDLGRAADISSDIMSAFGIKASEMGHVADVLTATCNNTNTNMEMLGDTMKYVGPVARTAGLSLEETATMAGILANSGIKASQGGTVLRGMLNRLAAPTGEAAKTLQKLGVTTQDAAGNLKKPITILKEMAASMKGMGNAAQMAALKTVFGEEAMAGVSVLLKKTDGDWNKLFDTLSNVDGVAQNTAVAMNNTLAGSMRGMGSAFESVQITIGKIFIPVLRKVVQAITSLLRWIDQLAQSPVGKFFLQLAAAISTVIVGITAFSGAMWALSSLGGMVARVFLPLKAAIMGVSAPMLVLVGIGAALYAAWKSDFGGIATVISGWWNKIKLVVNGVIAVFNSLKGSTGEIRGELAKEIKAAGLVGLVTTISKVIYRIREFFKGIWDGINFDGVTTALAPAIMKIRDLFDTVGSAIGKLFGSEVKSAATEARSLGSVVGGVLSKGFELLAVAINGFVNGIDSAISFVRMLVALFTGDFSGACEMASRIWQNFCDSIMSIADFLGIGDTIREFVEKIKSFFANLNIVEGIKSAWQAFVDFISGLNPLELLKNAFAGIADFGTSFDFVGGIQSAWDSFTTFVAGLNPLELLTSAFAGVTEFFASFDFVTGIQTAWQAVVDFFSGLNLLELISNAFAGITEFFASFDFVSGLQTAWQAVTAFFDGLNLFDSGAKLLGTFIDGIKSMVGSLVDSVSGALSKVRSFLPFSDAHEGPLSTLTLSGSRMMTTLAEGVNQGKGALTASVSGALGEAGKQIAGFQEELAPPTVQDPAKKTAQTLQAATNPTSGTSTPQLIIESPALPELQAPTLPELEFSESGLPKLAAEAVMPDIPQLAVESPQLPELSLPSLPGLELSEPELPQLSAVVPELPHLAIQNPTLPELQVQALPELEFAESGLPKLAAEAVMPDIPQLVVESPQFPELTVPALPGLELADTELPQLSAVAPELPQLSVESPVLPPMTQATPQDAKQGLLDMLGNGASQLASIVTGAIGEAGGKLSEMLGLSNAKKPFQEVPGLEIPVPESPAIRIPEAPAVAPEDTVHDRGHQEGKESQSKNQTVTITIGTINLPDVNDATSFVKSLQNVFQSEIGALEGMA